MHARPKGGARPPAAAAPLPSNDDTAPKLYLLSHFRRHGSIDYSWIFGSYVAYSHTISSTPCAYRDSWSSFAESVEVRGEDIYSSRCGRLFYSAARHSSWALYSHK